MSNGNGSNKTDDAILSGSAPNPESADKIEEGDVFDSDTGEFLCNLDLMVVKSFPVSFEILIDGYWYTYTVTSKEKFEKDKASAG
jgi:hypothetical protein